MPSSDPIPFDASDPLHLALVPSLVELHVACITHDNSLMRFHPPFDAAKRAKMLSFWEQRVQEVRDGKRISFVTVAPAPAPAPAPASSGREEEVMMATGIVELGLPDAETGPFRADVEMLMVHPQHRQEGLGKRLMRVLEREALHRGRTLLQLSTTKDSVADLYVYPKMGYIKYGVVPNYGIQPGDGKLVDGVYMYKDLREVSPLQ